jgi:hypothetical protein
MNREEIAMEFIRQDSARGLDREIIHAFLDADRFLESLGAPIPPQELVFEWEGKQYHIWCDAETVAPLSARLRSYHGNSPYRMG